jgi:transposase
VCWSDEVTFEVGADGSIFYVTRRSGKDEEWLDKNLKPSFKSGRTSVGVWSCYCGDKMGPLVILEKGERMTAQRYLEVAKKYFVLFYRRMRRKYGKDVVMQEDNASWHKAKLVTSYLDRQKVKRLHWPPQSPDLSPIENLWKQIKIIIGKKRHRIRNIKEMEDALSELWPILGGERLLKLNATMPKRLNLCIKNKGGSVK